MAIFSFMSPMLMVGKFLDWHGKTELQNVTKEKIGNIYLEASYGTLFKTYCNYAIRKFEKISAIRAYVYVLAAFISTVMLIELFLFRAIPINFLTQHYLKLAFFLSLFGVMDFFITKNLLSLVVRGRYKIAIALSGLFIYCSAIISSSIIAIIFLPSEIGINTYIQFFFNRLYVFAPNPFSGAMHISSKTTYVNAIVLAFPAFAISSFTLITSVAVAVLSSNKLSPVYDYLADRILGKDEKSIHLKIASLICFLLALVLATATS
jgi:hypothetical protein